MNLPARLSITLIAICFLFFSCSDLHNTAVQEDNLDQFSPTSNSVNTETNNLTGEIIRINNYDVSFNGKTYDESANQSTFSYTVTGTGTKPALNSLFIEVPSCAGNPAAFLPIQSAKVRENGIEWESSIPTSGSADYSITFSGNQPVGFVNATVESGNNTATEEIPGPCKGIYTISGNVYVDANSNQQKEGSESGIRNVTVQLIRDGNVLSTQKTSNIGSYIFNVFTGNQAVDFSINITDKTIDTSDFNEQLFDTYTPTTIPPSIPVIVDGSDIAGTNLGFLPQTQKIIQQFEDGTIQLNTEEPKFWIRQFRFAKKNNSRADIPADELLGYLSEIEGLLLSDPFQFGANKIDAALDILTRPIKTDLEALLVQLLTAELNAVSGRGSDSMDFDLALLAFGEAAANEELSDTQSQTLQNNITAESFKSETSTNFISDAESLLSSYNLSGSGGGVGNNK